LEVWKCGNMEMWNLEQLNSYITKLGSLIMWKFGNVEICLEQLIVNLPSLKFWKCGNPGI